MSQIFLTHKVKDFNAWKPFYDADKPRRQAAGLTELNVYREADDPNTVHILWESNNLDKFNAMVNDPGLAEAMEKAGVISKPSFVVLNKA